MIRILSSNLWRNIDLNVEEIGSIFPTFQGLQWRAEARHWCRACARQRGGEPGRHGRQTIQALPHSCNLWGWSWLWWLYMGMINLSQFCFSPARIPGLSIKVISPEEKRWRKKRVWIFVCKKYHILSSGFFCLVSWNRLRKEFPNLKKVWLNFGCLHPSIVGNMKLS